VIAKRYRHGFTMIELVFAIVILAISVLSLPKMIGVISTSMEKNILQEAIFMGSAQLSEASTYTWDEASTNDMNISEDARIVNTDTDGCPRSGAINRVCLSDTTIRPSDTKVANGNSIDSATYTDEPMIEGSTSASSYKSDYNATFSVIRCKSGGCIKFGSEATNSNPNIKQLSYTVKDKDGNIVIRLRSYSANIGELRVKGKTL